MNTTPKTPLAILADAADELHALADRLTDAAEELLPSMERPDVPAGQLIDYAVERTKQQPKLMSRPLAAELAYIFLGVPQREIDAYLRPAEPEDPRIVEVIDWWRGSIKPMATDKDAARDLLARLDAVRAES